MADDIDFLSGSCKQDVTDLICLSAHLNLNRRLEECVRETEGGEERENQKRIWTLSLSGDFINKIHHFTLFIIHVRCFFFAFS